MLAFYRSQLGRVLPLLITETDRVLTMVTVLAFLAALFNREAGKAVMSTWEGIDPWWAGLPVALLVIYGLMKAIYERYRQLETAYARIDESRAAAWAAAEKHQRQLEEIGTSFDLTYEPDEPSYVQPILQPSTLGGDGTWSTERLVYLHRIAVHNRGKRPATGVEVRLARTIPPGRSLMPARVQATESDVSQPLIVPVGDVPRMFDVVSKAAEDTYASLKLTDPGAHVISVPVMLQFQVAADNAPTITRWFGLDQEADGNLRMTEMPRDWQPQSKP